MPPREVVDVDLDVLLGSSKTFRFQGKVYHLPPEVPIETVTESVRLQQRAQAPFPEQEKGEKDEAYLERLQQASEDQMAAFQAMVGLVMALVRQMPGQTQAPDLPLGMTGVFALLGLAAGGRGEPVDDVVHEQISGKTRAERVKEAAAAKRNGKGGPPTSRKSASRSRARSHVPSSS